MKKLSGLGLFALALVALSAEETVWLGQTVDFRLADAEFNRPRLVTGESAAGKALQIAGQSYDQGVGTQLETTLALAVNGAGCFTALAGVDDATATDAAVIFEVQADGQTLWRSGERRKSQAPVAVDVDLHGRRELRLLTLEAGRTLSSASADWAGSPSRQSSTRSPSISTTKTVPSESLTQRAAANERWPLSAVFTA